MFEDGKQVHPMLNDDDEKFNRPIFLIFRVSCLSAKNRVLYTVLF